MAKMTEDDLLAIVDEAERDALTYNGQFIGENQQLLEYYLSEPFGDEVEGQSQVVSTDVQDVVEADMPSLVRVFLGAQDVITFDPQSSKPQDEAEADEKTKYINWIIRNQEDSYKVLHDWLKDADMQKAGILKIAYQTREDVREVKYDGLSEVEVAQLIDDLNEDADKVEIIGQSENDNKTYYVEFKIRRTVKEFVLINVPGEEFLLTRNARSIESAGLVGDKVVKTRSELIAEGFDEETVRGLPTYTKGGEEGSALRSIRARDQGGDDDEEALSHWASQEVELSDLYVQVDYDGDGIAERRHILKSGRVVLKNEYFPFAPYAVMSAISMPHRAIGRSRAELAKQTQRVKSVLFRQILDNVYRVNNARTVVNDDDTNMDDLLTVRPNGVVRTKGAPMEAVFQLQTPYIGDKALQVVQYVDSLRGESTGNNMMNQGLDSDQLYKETATRFRGVEEAGQAKIELVARTMAETGFKRLAKVLAWMVSHYQDDAKEILVLGKPLTVDPRRWRYDHPVTVTIHKDDETTLANLSGLLQTHQQLKATGSPITDDSKVYYILSKAVKAMGFNDPSRFYNDPTQPDQVLQAQVEQLSMMVKQLQMQSQQNPLAEAELIRAKAKMAEVDGKETNAMRQFEAEMLQRQSEFQQNLAKQLTELELKYAQNVPGAML